MDGPTPRLRALDATFTLHPERGRLLVLRDTEAISPATVSMRAELAEVIARLDGTRTAERVAKEAARASGAAIDVDDVREVLEVLDRAAMLETARFAAQKREVVGAFARAPVRSATHAGGAYHADPGALARFIEEECIAHAPAGRAPGRLVGLCAPHMDLWRAARGYGHAYRALHEGLAPEVDTVVLLGTSHALMRRPFAVCAKAFDTPFGALAPDEEALEELARASTFDLRADEYLHKAEHSIEFQAVFLQHLLSKAVPRAVKIIPVLCGLAEAQATRRQPESLRDAESFLGALASLVGRREGSVLVVAGADLAHVGPRFGDPAAFGEAARERLRARDAASIELARERDARRFFDDVASDLDERRVCGLGPVYTMLRVLGEGTGHLLHYTQHVDDADGSIVSHASLAYVA